MKTNKKKYTPPTLSTITPPKPEEYTEWTQLSEGIFAVSKNRKDVWISNSIVFASGTAKIIVEDNCIVVATDKAKVTAVRESDEIKLWDMKDKRLITAKKKSIPKEKYTTVIYNFDESYTKTYTMTYVMGYNKASVDASHFGKIILWNKSKAQIDAEAIAYAYDHAQVITYNNVYAHLFDNSCVTVYGSAPEIFKHSKTARILKPYKTPNQIKSLFDIENIITPNESKIPHDMWGNNLPDCTTCCKRYGTPEWEKKYLAKISWGAYKFVIVTKLSDYVYKIPRQNNIEENLWKEVYLYKKAEEAGIGFLFCHTYFAGEHKGARIYKQEKVLPQFNSYKMSISKSDKEFLKKLNIRRPEDGLIKAIHCIRSIYNDEIAIKFINFVKKYKIDDFNAGNFVSNITKKYFKFLDFSGRCSQHFTNEEQLRNEVLFIKK